MRVVYGPSPLDQPDVPDAEQEPTLPLEFPGLEVDAGLSERELERVDPQPGQALEEEVDELPEAVSGELPTRSPTRSRASRGADPQPWGPRSRSRSVLSTRGSRPSPSSR